MNQTTANAAALALVGTLALQLAACGTAQQSAPGQASTQPEPVTLTMSWWGDDARTETYQQAIQAFEAKLQYITVETIYGTTADEDQTADVMQVDWTWPGQNADQFVDLNEYSDVIDLEQFSQSALDACTVDGALLAVPMSVTGRIFYWNTCTFEQAGIDAPKTYEELLTAGNTFREVLGEEYYPLAMDAAARMNLMVSYLESTTGKAWVVDRQLQKAIMGMEHKAGLIRVMDDKCVSADLAIALNGNTKIIATTIQKFPYIVDSVANLKNKRFAVIIDEAHSSTAGKDMADDAWIRRRYGSGCGRYDFQRNQAEW